MNSSFELNDIGAVCLFRRSFKRGKLDPLILIKIGSAKQKIDGLGVF